VLQKLFAAMASQDVLAKVTCKAFGASAPQADLVLSVHDANAHRKTFGRQAIEILVQERSHANASQKRTIKKCKSKATK
jgi:predicted glycosyltransferase